MLASAVPGALAQSSVSPLSRTHAIVDARVEIGDGRVLERATILVKDGRIVAVGPDIVVPKGADVLAAKGLTVYPGFIDAYTTKGVKTPSVPNRQDDSEPISEVATAFMRDANRKQVHPEIEARQYLEITDDLRKPYLQAGFTTLFSVPGGIGLRGQGTLINLSGRATRESVVVPIFGQAVSFDGDGADQQYPASLLGSLAQFRQALEDARWQDAVKASPRGLRPFSDPTLETLGRLLSQRSPFFVEANTVAEIDRVRRISSEYNFAPIVVGAAEAWQIPQLVAPTGRLVLGLTSSEEAKPVEKAKEIAPEAVDDAVAEPDDALRVAERARIVKEAIANPGALEKAGVHFALTTKSSKDVGNFLASLRRAVSAGLSKTAALRALTVDAAALFGVSSDLGTIEVGKQATFSVQTGDFLDEKTKIRVLYIDGYRIDPAVKPNVGSPRITAGHEE